MFMNQMRVGVAVAHDSIVGNVMKMKMFANHVTGTINSRDAHALMWVYGTNETNC